MPLATFVTTLVFMLDTAVLKRRSFHSFFKWKLIKGRIIDCRKYKQDTKLTYSIDPINRRTLANLHAILPVPGIIWTFHTIQLSSCLALPWLPATSCPQLHQEVSSSTTRALTRRFSNGIAPCGTRTSTGSAPGTPRASIPSIRMTPSQPALPRHSAPSPSSRRWMRNLMFR